MDAIDAACLMIGANEEQVTSLMSCVESLIVREIVVGGRNPNAFEKIFAGAAQDLYANGRGDERTRQTALDAAVSALARNFSGPAIFDAAFSELSVTTPRARVLLDSMERTLQRETYGGVLPDCKPGCCQHIFPETDGRLAAINQARLRSEEERNRLRICVLPRPRQKQRNEATAGRGRGPASPDFYSHSPLATMEPGLHGTSGGRSEAGIPSARCGANLAAASPSADGR